MTTKHKIRHDVSIIPDFEKRLAYWDARRESDTEPESDIEIIFCEEIECAIEYLSVVSVDAEQEDINTRLDKQYALLKTLRGVIDEFAPGGLKEYVRRDAQARDSVQGASQRLQKLASQFQNQE